MPTDPKAVQQRWMKRIFQILRLNRSYFLRRLYSKLS